MPTKKKEEKPTRGEQLPGLRTVLDALSRKGPNEAFAIDEVLEEMLSRGWVDMALPMLEYGGVTWLRNEVLDAVRNAYTAATSVYSDRARKGEREMKVASALKLQRALTDFISENREEAALIGEIRLDRPEAISPSDFIPVDDAQRLLISMEKYIRGINRGRKTTVGDTANFLNLGFVRELKIVFRRITGDPKLIHGQKELLMRLAVAAWIDARLPGYDDPFEKLDARTRKWFGAKKEDLRSIS